MNYFLLYLSVGFISQWQYILEKVNYINGLKFYIQKATSYSDIIIGVIFFPVYLSVDYLQEHNENIADKIFNMWVEVLWIFLWIPFYFPMSLLLKLEQKLRK